MKASTAGGRWSSATCSSPAFSTRNPLEPRLREGANFCRLRVSENGNVLFDIPVDHGDTKDGSVLLFRATHAPPLSMFLSISRVSGKTCLLTSPRKSTIPYGRSGATPEFSSRRRLRSDQQTRLALKSRGAPESSSNTILRSHVVHHRLHICEHWKRRSLSTANRFVENRGVTNGLSNGVLACQQDIWGPSHMELSVFQVFSGKDQNHLSRMRPHTRKHI